jgi:hypothetical protein
MRWAALAGMHRQTEIRLVEEAINTFCCAWKSKLGL